jgi:MiaB-like tRNA modifying enzyme
MKKVFIETHGCSFNQADSEIITGLLKQKKFEIVSSAKDSDLIILNTCNVKLASSQRMVYRIKELTKLSKPLVVAGCMPKTERKVIEKINPGASLIGPNSIQKIVDVTQEAIKVKKKVALEDIREAKVCLPRIRKNPMVNIIQIAEGCAWRKCSYCIVRFARGELLSYPVDLIVEEIKKSLKEGVREVWVCSQDTASYGLDTEGMNLPNLLDEICKVKGDFFVRVGMMNPLHAKEIIDELINSYRNKKIFKFLHLPIQSASERTLDRMNRGYEVKDFLEIVDRFRKEFPRITILTDVIVGFPTESKKEFEETVKFIEKIRPGAVNISKFGSRPGTEAAKMKQLDKKTVNERSEIFHRLTKKISLEINREWVGWEGEALIDEKVKNGFVGRNFSYKPIVIKTDEKIFGKKLNVEVIDATSNCLFAKRN